MPVLSIQDAVLLSIATSPAAVLSSMPAGRYPMPVADLVRQATSDRLGLAGEALRSGDRLLRLGDFRASIGRNYYAMYHAGRAVTFADAGGDDHERHPELPNHLPSSITQPAQRQADLVAARLLRNEADYNAYPIAPTDWEEDARELGATAAAFVQACEDCALQNGYV